MSNKEVIVASMSDILIWLLYHIPLCPLAPWVVAAAVGSRGEKQI